MSKVKAIFQNKWVRLIGISSIIALPILFGTIFMSNQSWTLGGEKTILMWFEHVSKDSPERRNEWKDSLLLIDVHDDKTLVTLYDEDSLKCGTEIAVNHAHLYRMLQDLQKADNYRYIILDVFLDKEIAQSGDSTLYQLIASMSRIVVACGTEPLADSCLYSKAGSVQYSTTLWENDFVKYTYIDNGQRSMPLFMYEELTGKHVVRKGPFLCEDGDLVQRNVILTYNVVWNKRLYDRRLCSDMICDDSSDEPAILPSRSDGKYVLIGDFKSDIHNTFLGEMPGILINFNAYCSLVKGHHRLSLWYLFNLYVVFVLLVLLTIHRSTLARFVMWFGYPVILGALCLTTYICYHQTYDVLSITLLYYLLEKLVYIWECRESIRWWFKRNKVILWVRKKLEKHLK